MTEVIFDFPNYKDKCISEGPTLDTAGLGRGRQTSTIRLFTVPVRHVLLIVEFGLIDENVTIHRREPSSFLRKQA